MTVTQETPDDQSIELVIGHVVHAPLVVDKERVGLLLVLAAAHPRDGHPRAAPIHAIVPRPQPPISEPGRLAGVEPIEPHVAIRVVQVPIDQIDYGMDRTVAPAPGKQHPVAPLMMDPPSDIALVTQFRNIQLDLRLSREFPDKRIRSRTADEDHTRLFR